MAKTKVAVIQMACEPSVDANLAKAVARVREAAEAGAKLICLPELFRAQYFCQREDHALFDVAESIPGPSTAALSEVVREHKIVVVASLFERRAPGLYHNTAAILDHTSDKPDNIMAIYRKMHIPDDPLYYEKFYFTPGDLGFSSQRTSAGPIGTLVCWDQWYPEGARLTALRGAETLFFPTAIGWHPSEKEEFGERQYDAWQTIQRAHAIANGVWVCAVNRVGHEQGDVEINGELLKGPEGAGLEFWGGSFIADPFGRIIAKASHDKEEILYAELDSKEVEITRQHWPFLRDRRIDAYEGITKRFLD
ncbi:N-carbamoylputrescine amidase [Bryocella elongata]|uniref:N-carbamoylputrescine amidase n=1 Tax=Bryocella elongata TaxID=863522 RepID=A0A1H5SZY2_9BACT|nr:carbon-nitrogen hydrolase [Bryocella elongata]SEF56100.1 N-carbamoylputrescine amidase [Bryocella elongata]